MSYKASIVDSNQRTVKRDTRENMHLKTIPLFIGQLFANIAKKFLDDLQFIFEQRTDVYIFLLKQW